MFPPFLGQISHGFPLAPIALASPNVRIAGPTLYERGATLPGPTATVGRRRTRRGGSMRLLLVPGVLLAAAQLLAVGPADPAAPPALVRVEVTVRGPVEQAVALIEGLGGEIEMRSGSRVQALLPGGSLAALEAAPALLRVERPALIQPLELSAAASLIGADRWQAAGFTGRGARVAVIDTGFEGYEATFAETAALVHTRAFRFDGSLEGGSDHGRQAAEIVYEMAPGAELYLLSFSTVTELSAAVDYAIAEDVDVISLSVGFIHNGPGDGSGAVNEIVDRAVEAGVALWTVAAGNWAEQHWAGPFSDSDDDLVHEFSPGTELNGREYLAGDLITASLRWDDEWGAACVDYDLELFGPDGSLVQASRRIQDCTGDPVEGFRVLATSAGRYSARVVAATPSEPRDLDLLLLGSPDRGERLEYFVRAGSLSEPADHPWVVTVGALAGDGSLAQAPFSSRGATADGRAKPDLVSPTGLAALVEGEGPALTQFSGTSAAAPFVAGAAGLLIEALPGLGRDDLVALLRSRALTLPGSEGAAVALAQLGPLGDLGPLLPAGGLDAELAGGALPASGGLVLVVYRGPDGYPLRFVHLLTGDPTPFAFFRFLADEERWDRHIVGAPRRVNTFDAFEDGDVLVLRFAR